MCSIKFTSLYSSVHWKRRMFLLTPHGGVWLSSALQAKQSQALTPGCLHAISELSRSGLGLLPEAPHLRNVLPFLTGHGLKSVKLSAQSGLFPKAVGGLGSEIKVVQVFIYYDHRVVYPSHPFIGTGDALVTAKNIISVLFPLPTTCPWLLCSLWPNQGPETVSWPRGWNMRWLTSQARMDALRRHGPVT